MFVVPSTYHSASQIIKVNGDCLSIGRNGMGCHPWLWVILKIYSIKVPVYGHWTTFTLLPLLFSQSWTIWFIFVLADTVDGASLTDRIDSIVISGHVCPQQASLLTWDQGANKVIAPGLQRCFLSLSSFHGRNSWKGSDSCVSSREESPLFVMTTGTLIRQCTQEKQTVLVVLSWEGLLIVRGQDTTVSFYQSRPQKSKFTFCLFTSLFLVFRHE